MAKSGYRIATSLDRSYLDHEITLAGRGWQARPLPMKVILFWLMSLLGLLWALMSTFLSSGGFLLDAAVVIYWLAATAFFGALTKTKELRFRTVPALLAYAPKAARNVLTRRSSNPSEFASIVGIDAVHDDGRIEFTDGHHGRAYLVVGSASILLFEQDKTGILDRVDAFWRKAETTCEYIFVTAKEPQRIYQQVANLERRNLDLEVRDPDLVELMDEQYDILTEHVGGRFNSIHQYVVLKATSADELRRAHNALTAEVEGSNFMIKECVRLDRDETLRMLKVFYTGVETSPLLTGAAA